MVRLGMGTARLITLLCASTAAAPAGDWAVARNGHAAVYSQAGQASARSILAWLEQLRIYFRERTGFEPGVRPPLRVVAFRSAADYEPYRIRPVSDGYYVGAGDRDYIVLSNPANLRMAAHEYWHFVERASSLHLSPWLNEGLAGFYSGESHPEVLRNGGWIPLADLLALPDDSRLRDDRAASSVYYAETAALAGMLMTAPEYAPRVRGLFAAVGFGAADGPALSRICGKPLDAIEHDLRVWADKQKPGVLRLPDLPLAAETSNVSPVAARTLLAEILLAANQTDRAEALYRELAREVPDDPAVSAALAWIAFGHRDYDGARRHWSMALERGLRDAAACFRYAALAQNAGFPAAEIRPVLERAVALQPDFDDALYMLGLLEGNAGESARALGHLRAMRSISPGRQYAWWIAVASALADLGRREEAKAAADQAGAHAGSPEEREHAAELGVIAMTEMAVQFARDSEGNLRLVTTRTPYDAPEWNPFIEPGDRVRRAEGRLRAIECEGALSIFDVETAAGTVRLTVPDPGHVQMVHAPAEFECGEQPLPSVVAVYAALGESGGVLRGLEFR